MFIWPTCTWCAYSHVDRRFVGRKLIRMDACPWLNMMGDAMSCGFGLFMPLQNMTSWLFFCEPRLIHLASILIKACFIFDFKRGTGLILNWWDWDQLAMAVSWHISSFLLSFPLLVSPSQFLFTIVLSTYLLHFRLCLLCTCFSFFTIPSQGQELKTCF